jgi:UDPglucose 6-dehydrogenase
MHHRTNLRYLWAMKMDSNKTSVAIIGLGKLGLPLSLVIHSGGSSVVGYDLNSQRVSQLKRREYDGPEPKVKELLLGATEGLTFTNEIGDIRECEIAYIIVPTPSDLNGVFGSNLVEDAIKEVRECWKGTTSQKVIVIVSTVMPGTTEGLISNYVSTAEYSNIHLLYSPEFIALGSVVENLYYPDSILIGSNSKLATKKHLEISSSYLLSTPELRVLNPTEAELAKILVNTYVTMKISFANFIGEIATLEQNVNASLVAQAVGTDSRIGQKYLKPGLGFGGPCFPRDNQALIAYSRMLGLDASLAVATDKINLRQPGFFISRIEKVRTNERRIGILGLTYKQNSEVTEASQGVLLANELHDLGFEVHCFDDYVLERPRDLNQSIKFSKDISDLQLCEVIIELVESKQNYFCNSWNVPILKP